MIPVFGAEFFFWGALFLFDHPGHHPADHPGIILVCSLLAAFECTFMKGFICGRRQLCVVGFYDASSWCHPAHVAKGPHHPPLGPHHPAIILSPSFSASMSCHHPSALIIRHRPTSSCHHPFIILLGQYSLSSSIGPYHHAVIPSALEGKR